MSYREALSRVFRAHHAALVARMRASFPACAAAAEDVVSATFEQALSRQAFSACWRRSGDRGLERLLFTATWRTMNTHQRATRRRQRLLADQPTARSTLATPERIALARETTLRVAAEVPRAGRRFGGRDPAALERAVWDALTGLSDSASARRHGVRREAVNKARRWVRREAEAP